MSLFGNELVLRAVREGLILVLAAMGPVLGAALVRFSQSLFLAVATVR